MKVFLCVCVGVCSFGCKFNPLFSLTPSTRGHRQPRWRCWDRSSSTWGGSWQTWRETRPCCTCLCRWPSSRTGGWAAGQSLGRGWVWARAAGAGRPTFPDPCRGVPAAAGRGLRSGCGTSRTSATTKAAFQLVSPTGCNEWTGSNAPV